MRPDRHVPFTLAIGSESYFLALPASPVSGETRPPVDDNPLSPQTSVQLAILANALGSTGEPLTEGFGANPAGETGVVEAARETAHNRWFRRARWAVAGHRARSGCH